MEINITVEEYNALAAEKGEMKVKLAALQSENDALRDELERTKAELNVARSHNESKDIENLYLKSMLHLSVERIKVFMDRLTNIDRWSFLRSFVCYTLPDQHHNEQMEVVEQVMALPQPDAPHMTVDTMYKIMGNDNVNIGGTNNE